jgi:hypothetical protein
MKILWGISFLVLGGRRENHPTNLATWNVGKLKQN